MNGTTVEPSCRHYNEQRYLKCFLLHCLRFFCFGSNPFFSRLCLLQEVIFPAAPAAAVIQLIQSSSRRYSLLRLLDQRKVVSGRQTMASRASRRENASFPRQLNTATASNNARSTLAACFCSNSCAVYCMRNKDV